MSFELDRDLELMQLFERLGYNDARAHAMFRVLQKTASCKRPGRYIGIPEQLFDDLKDVFTKEHPDTGDCIQTYLERLLLAEGHCFSFTSPHHSPTMDFSLVLSTK